MTATVEKTSDDEYVARLVFKRNLHQTLENAHRAVREAYDAEINRIGTKLDMQEVEKKESPSEPRPEISEDPFNSRKYQTAKAESLGDYDICFRNENNADEWQHCFNVLKANNSTIKNHFSEPSWKHYYWVYEKYDDRFYRKAKSN